jgi:uncharacterized protein YcbX
VLVETDADHRAVEAGWGGRTIRIGRATLRGEFPTMRCVMVTLPQPGLPKAPAVLRSIVRDAGQNFGLYAAVTAGGEIAVGDPVVLV